MNIDYVNTPSDIAEAIEQAEIIEDFLPSLYQLDLKEATGNRFDSFMVREKSPITNFEWDSQKDIINQSKHQVSFSEAQLAFRDSHRIIAVDHKHSTPEETRYFCFGRVGGSRLNSSIYLSDRQHSHIRCRLLARRKEAL